MYKRDEKIRNEGRHEIADPLGRKLEDISKATDLLGRDVQSFKEENLNYLERMVSESKDNAFGIKRFVTFNDIPEEHDRLIVVELTKRYCFDADILENESVSAFIKEINQNSDINTLKGTRIRYKSLLETEDPNLVSELLLELICMCNALAKQAMEPEILDEIIDYLEIAPAKRSSIVENVTENAKLYSVRQLSDFVSRNSKDDDNAIKEVHYFSPIQPVVNIRAYRNKPDIVESLFYINNVKLAEYQRDLKSRKISAEPYFSKDDGEIYEIVKKILETEYGTEEYYQVVLKLSRHINITHRQIVWDKKKFIEGDNKKYFASELLQKDIVKESYDNGEIIKSKKGKGGRNVLKEIAWACVHNGMIAYFMAEKQIQELIPKTRNPERIKMWNQYVSSMYDIPDEIKQLFLMKMSFNPPSEMGEQAKP